MRAPALPALASRRPDRAGRSHDALEDRLRKLCRAHIYGVEILHSRNLHRQTLGHGGRHRLHAAAARMSARPRPCFASSRRLSAPRHAGEAAVRPEKLGACPRPTCWPCPPCRAGRRLIDMARKSPAKRLRAAVGQAQVCALRSQRRAQRAVAAAQAMPCGGAACRAWPWALAGRRRPSPRARRAGRARTAHPARSRNRRPGRAANGGGCAA